jgi:hypothetical protein
MSSPVWRTTSPVRHRGDRPDAELRSPQRSAAGLAPGQHAGLSPHRIQLGGEPVDLPQPGQHGLPSAGDSSTCPAATRPSGVVIEPITGTPWWNKVAAIR